MEANKDRYEPSSLEEVQAESLLRELPEYDFEKATNVFDGDKDFALAMGFYELASKVSLAELSEGPFELQGSDGRMMLEIIGITDTDNYICAMLNSESGAIEKVIIDGAITPLDDEHLACATIVEIMVGVADVQKNSVPIKYTHTDTGDTKLAVYAKNEIARDSIVVYKKIFTKDELGKELARKVNDQQNLMFVAHIVHCANGSMDTMYVDMSSIFIQPVSRFRKFDEVGNSSEQFGRQDSADWQMIEYPTFSNLD